MKSNEVLRTLSGINIREELEMGSHLGTLRHLATDFFASQSGDAIGGGFHEGNRDMGRGARDDVGYRDCCGKLSYTNRVALRGSNFDFQNSESFHS